jgi:hypothetical protein
MQKTGSVEWLFTCMERKSVLNGKRSLTRLQYVPRVPLTTVRCYPCRKFPLNSYKSLLFHGGDRGSIPYVTPSYQDLAEEPGAYCPITFANAECTSQVFRSSIILEVCNSTVVQIAHPRLPCCYTGFSEARENREGKTHKRTCRTASCGTRTGRSGSAH